MKVCRYDQGNALVLTCPFHGWTYDTDGRLVGVPGFKEFYHEDLDRSQWGLIEVAQLANYHGSIWATWDSDAPPFEQYLGDYDFYLRPHFEGDDGRDGGAEIFGGIQKWRMPCNWKFPALTFNGDRSHAAMTHRSTTVAAFGPQGALAEGFRHGIPSRRVPLQYEVLMPGLGHGGAATIRPADEPYVDTWQTVPGADDYYRAMHQKRADQFPDRPRVQAGCNVFPNFITGGAVRTIAVWHPAGPHATEVWRFFLVDSQAPEAVRDGLRRFQMRYSGPVGMTEQDDMENWNYAHAASRGTIARRYAYNYQMGLGHEIPAGEVPGSLNQITAEHAQRGRFARWLEFMEAPTWRAMHPRRANGAT
jgi:phenylpropionate dioxygenase-like ring-hydroxylating dioxygenase large terminal subunit